MKLANRTIQQAQIAQGAAGSTDLVVAAGADQRIFVVSITGTMSAAGTLKFQEGGATDLSGPMDLALAGGIVEIGDGESVVIQTKTVNQKLNIVTTVGKFNGWLRYYTAPET